MYQGEQAFFDFWDNHAVMETIICSILFVIFCFTGMIIFIGFLIVWDETYGWKRLWSI